MYSFFLLEIFLIIAKLNEYSVFLCCQALLSLEVINLISYSPLKFSCGSSLVNLLLAPHHSAHILSPLFQCFFVLYINYLLFTFFLSYFFGAKYLRKLDLILNHRRYPISYFRVILLTFFSRCWNFLFYIVQYIFDFQHLLNAVFRVIVFWHEFY